MSYFDFYIEELTAGQRQELNGLMAIHEKAGARPYDAAMQAVRDKLAQAHENKAEVERVIFESANPLKKYVDSAAHKAASSPKNKLPIPTAAQREAGNHTMGHLTLHGLSITIEIPKGGERSGIAPDGTPWSVEMLSHYGYLKRAIGADGENFDCYIGDDPSSQRVWIVDQVNAETGAFDEHKALLGYEDQEDATRSYLGAFSDGKGKARIGAITEISLESFKDWLNTDKTRKPMSAVLESGVDYRSAIETATTFEEIEVVFGKIFTDEIDYSREDLGLSPSRMDELRLNQISWFAYKQARYGGLSHDDAVEKLLPREIRAARAVSTQIILTIPNTEDGVEAIVAKIQGGYSVVLRDVDADMIAQTAKIFQTEEDAINYAKQIAGV